MGKQNEKQKENFGGLFRDCHDGSCELSSYMRLPLGKAGWRKRGMPGFRRLAYMCS